MPLHRPSPIQRAEETASTFEAPTSERPALDLGERVLRRAMPRGQQPVMGQPTPRPPIVQRTPQRGEPPAPQSPPAEGSGAMTSAGTIEPPVKPVEESAAETRRPPTTDESTARLSITRMLRERIARAAESPAAPASENEAAPIESTSSPHAPLQLQHDEMEIESPTAQPIKRAEIAPATSRPTARASSEMPLVTRVMRKPSGQEERSSGEETPAPRPTAPLPLVRSTSAPKIQRTIETAAPAISRVSQPVVQRTLGETTASNEPASAPAVDLDQLARDVYPYLRRLIAVERERGG